jgi:uncharacterized membrane protein YebE (DUF533 family)
MKISLMQATLGMMALGMMASAAHANWDRDIHLRHYTAQQSRFYVQQIDTRQHQLIERIQRAQRQQLLSRAEFRALMHEQHQISAMKRNFQADGIIDAREFRRLDRALELASHTLRMTLHAHQARSGSGTPRRFNSPERPAALQLGGDAAVKFPSIPSPKTWRTP